MYLFGGTTEIDLAQIARTLAAALGTERLIVEGAPHVSGSFVNAGLVDEISTLVLPLIDGRGAHPASFEVAKHAWMQPTYPTLISAEIQTGGSVWLRWSRLVDRMGRRFVSSHQCRISARL